MDTDEKLYLWVVMALNLFADSTVIWIYRPIWFLNATKLSYFTVIDKKFKYMYGEYHAKSERV